MLARHGTPSDVARSARALARPVLRAGTIMVTNGVLDVVDRRGAQRWPPPAAKRVERPRPVGPPRGPSKSV